MFFNGWGPIWQIIITGVIVYFLLILSLRISGKRTLSKMNAFDLIITVALGSTLATIILSKDVAILEGVAALTTLISLQYVIAWISVRSEQVRRLVKSDPMMLMYRGQFLFDVMKSERVTRDEVLAAVRAGGIGSLENVTAVVLETDGSFSVIGSKEEKSTALQDVGDNLFRV
jgi:uncharacterized membrane protein YcaP (DUF421 family)